MDDLGSLAWLCSCQRQLYYRQGMSELGEKGIGDLLEFRTISGDGCGSGELPSRPWPICVFCRACYKGDQIAYTPLEEAVAQLRPVDERIYEIARMMEM